VARYVVLHCTSWAGGEMFCSLTAAAAAGAARENGQQFVRFYRRPVATLSRYSVRLGRVWVDFPRDAADRLQRCAVDADRSRLDAKFRYTDGRHDSNGAKSASFIGQIEPRPAIRAGLAAARRPRTEVLTSHWYYYVTLDRLSVYSSSGVYSSFFQSTQRPILSGNWN